MARNQSGSGSSSEQKAGQSETKTSTKGTVIKLETGTNKTYLCAHICAANKSEPYRVCRRLNILRDYSDEKTKLYPRN
ncbi:hypothetical protein KWF02_16850 [Acinetobacter baumannii]|uniref:hypothetical protein n=1 Tax=Acinetobacter baumannii TaxID=470 RepID=UPI000DE5D37F|nr:hypothetical protein [Acinetobacter baumannii]MDC4491423.1 hypothetical protein [Acinetobacter baumannii]SSQ72409.1 Uncharacterised protein [Acinetobacter baumannii]